MGDDRRYMTLALELATQGAGRTAPNPMVGCILVRDGEVVGEGWHKAAGEPHAEAEALAAAGDRARGGVAYVTLEPCNHYGRTPPCAEALAKAGIGEVVYAMADPHPQAAGGADYLRARGVKVRCGVCEDEARALNRFWLHAVEHARPYVIAKFAMSLDGKIATRSGDSKWITGPEARERAHALRGQVDAIVVGADTVIADDPSLTARDGLNVMNRPLRIILDSEGRTPPAAAVFDRAGRGALLVATDRAPAARLDAYRALGADILVLGTDEAGRPDVAELMPALGKRGVCGLMVEGGSQVLGAFFDAGAVDEVWAFIAPVIIGGGVSAVAGRGAERVAEALSLTEIEYEHLGGDLLVRGLVARSKGGR
jgi:diaminohydroxyphosphoribosylaminopyrimidine deaminase/5-amino-6-(5-phosphoribosylamino)uracil reductase